MKFTTSILFPLFTLTSLSQLTTKQLACSNDIRSCSASATDTCCSPKLGLLVLALQWYPGLGPKDAFTVHGLWPNNCDGSFGPNNGCDSTRQYTDLKNIVAVDTSLETQMNTYWASYKGDNPSFWEHEWGKHGTCYSIYEPKCYTAFQRGQDARDYFKTALTLRTKFDLYNTLKSSGITPGRSYSKSDIIAAFNKLGAQVQLTCTNGAISEVKVYMYVNGKSDFKITNAPSAGSCPSTISYPIKN
ncbi:RNase Sy [Neoconidiobolus thromboides FSU 785]|nr:RNase Sy [Neoconidiobolus thromboides FSU 785]